MKLEHSIKEEDKQFLVELVQFLKSIKIEIVVSLEKK